jgi:hypothetical protein
MAVTIWDCGLRIADFNHYFDLGKVTGLPEERGLTKSAIRNPKSAIPAGLAIFIRVVHHISC